MKAFITITSALITVLLIAINLYANFAWKRDYLNEWSLADKSSTIAAKQQHISAFVAKIEDGNRNRSFASHDATMFKQPGNSFEANFTALKTLESRLDEVSGMNPSSFEYNTAIQQITQQEQGEANEMLSAIQGCWELSEYPITWGWIGVVLIVLFGGISVVAFFVWMDNRL